MSLTPSKVPDHAGKQGADALGRKLVKYWLDRGAIGVGYTIDYTFSSSEANPYYALRLTGMHNGRPILWAPGADRRGV